MTSIVRIIVDHLMPGKKIVVREQPKGCDSGAVGGAPRLEITQAVESKQTLAVWDSNQLVITEEDDPLGTN